MAEEQFLVPLDEYLKVGLHIGTKFRTKFMAPFIYKVRSDGLAILNVQDIDKRLKIASNFLNQFDQKDILIACRRENGWKSAKLFSKLTGIKVFTGRYPPGILTNINLKSFTEAKILLVTDPWPDRNAINDASKLGIPIIALCDTNNDPKSVDFVVPCNNKGKKSLGLVFWILAREFLKSKKLIKDEKEMIHSLEDFASE